MAGPIRYRGQYQPSVEWFNDPVDKDSALATPNVFSNSASSAYGRIGVDNGSVIKVIHFHLAKDGASSSYDLEVWRFRWSDPSWVKIATISVASGSGDGSTADFTFVSDEMKSLQGQDYLFLQATSKMGGSPVGFVDVHFQPQNII